MARGFASAQARHGMMTRFSVLPVQAQPSNAFASCLYPLVSYKKYILCAFDDFHNTFKN
jgi:hypothetical protein